MSLGRKMLSFVALVFAFAALSTFAVAQQTPETKVEETQPNVEGQKREKGSYGRGEGRRFHGRKHHRRGLGRDLRKIDLNEGQDAQIKSIMESHKTGQKPYRDEMRSLAMRFRDGSASESDKARIKELKMQMHESSEQLRNSILGVLTPGQLEQLEQMKAERQQRMQERRQRWMERKQRREAEKPVKTDN